MNEIHPENNESKMHLDAMLYLLDDPSLDRQAFEKQLAEDANLAEVLAEAVVAFHSLQRVESWRSEPASNVGGVVPLRRIPTTMAGFAALAGFAAMAASLLIAGFIGWRWLDHMRPSTNEIALAWGEMNLESIDSSSVRDASDHEFENSIAFSSIESFAEVDVPEWLVLATSDTAEGAMDFQEGRVRIQ